MPSKIAVSKQSEAISTESDNGPAALLNRESMPDMGASGNGDRSERSAKRTTAAARVEDVLKDALEVAMKCGWIREYVVSPFRKWRVDLALPEQRIAIEVDGRHHLHAKQHRADCEKANYLSVRGWRVFRFPASCVLTKKRLPRIVEQVCRALCLVDDDDSDSCVLVGE